MRRWFTFAVALSVVGMILGACKMADPEADKAAIRALVEEDSTYFQGGTSRGDSNPPLLDDTTVAWWWRGPQTHDPQPGIEIGVEGDSAWVEWSQHNYGSLFIWAKRGETTAVRWEKPLVETAKLRALFSRVGTETDDNRGWRLKSISLASGQSDSSQEAHIDSMRIESSLRNIVIADPLEAFYRVDSLVWFTPGELLTITLYTNVPDGRAFLHTFAGIFPVRVPFNSEGDGRFTGTWRAQLIPWLRFAIFDLQTRGTTMDPTAPYDYNGWLLPYLIKGAD